MIKIDCNKTYRLFKNKFNLQLENFAIIIGLNGSGKSILLDSIYNNEIQSYIIEDEVETELSRFDIKLFKNDFLINNNLYDEYTSFDNYLQSINNLHKELQKEYFNNNKIYQVKIKLNEDKDNEFKYIKEIANKLKKEIYQLDIFDFIVNLPNNNKIFYETMFVLNLKQIFLNYSERVILYKYHQYLLWLKDKNIPILNEEEIISKLGIPPWLEFQNLLNTVELNYEIKIPNTDVIDYNYSPKFINNINKEEIDFRDLSSGEKIILKLFYATYQSNHLNYNPKLLLLDEPDAFLHPKTIQKMIDVFEKYYNQQKKIKVIITSHSLTTISLSEGNNIYYLDNNTNILSKIEKDKAISNLAHGVNNLSIDYLNRKLIFVESLNDVDFYNKLYKRYKSKNGNIECQLIFIDSGIKNNSSGSRDEVKDIVKKLRDLGIKKVYGLIDWDKKNISNNTNKIFVNGENVRYTIENYLYDPYVVYSYIMNKHSSFLQSQFDFKLNFSDINSLDNLQKTQIEIDKFIAKYYKIESLNSNNTIKIKYLNDFIFEFPKMIFEHNGKEIKKFLLKNIECLKNVQDKDLLDFMINFDKIPLDIFELFEKIEKDNLN